MGKPADDRRHLLNLEVLVGLIGFVLSIVLHELFHVLMHWGNIKHVSIFPNPTTLIQIDTWMPSDYNLDDEEIAAYGITLLVVIVTVAIIFKMRDTEDKRSAKQILFPEDSSMRKLNPSEMLELSGLDEDDQMTRASGHRPGQSK